MEQQPQTVSSKQQWCYVHVRGNKPGQRIGIVRYLDSGYYPATGDVKALDEAIKDADALDDLIDRMNETELGVSVDVRAAMEAGSMFGWRVPAAVAALKHYGAPEIDAA